VKVGLLALQGAVGLHAEVFGALGVTCVEVRTEAELADVDALVIPGGESTTISRLLATNNLFDPIAERLAAGLPTLGTCAGMIMLAGDVLDGRPDQRSFGAVDIAVRRNAFGRQVDSFEAPLRVHDLSGGAFHGVFIRAPFVERVGSEVSVIAEVDGHPVACRQGQVVVTSFHPELATDPVSGEPDRRVHELFLRLVA
jgi:5'-phosphate synthase pdxT subunit